MDLLQVVLCDDDSQILDCFGEQIKQLARKHKQELKLSCYTSAQAMLFAAEDLLKDADIFYLDVQMKPIGGIDAARQLRALGYSAAQLIFLTNAPEYVFDSFDVSPLQYLVKGSFTPEKFEQVFLRAMQLCQHKSSEQLLCERGSDRRAIPLHEISYFEVRKRIVTVYYDGGEFAFYSSIDELEQRLQGKGFVRPHRSFLVCVARIRRLGQDTLELTGGTQIPLGRTHAKNVKERLSSYLANHIHS